MAACGGGGSNPAPAAVPLGLQITPFEGNPIGTDPINSDGVGLLNENADGSITTVDIGTLTDNKNANGEAYYALPETAPTGTNNDEFDIMGETGEQVLQFRGKYAGDYEASTRPKYTLKIERYDNKQHYDSVKAGEAGAKPPQILDYILNLKNLETLPVTAIDGAPFSVEDGQGFLNEEIDGSGEGNAILLSRIGDGSANSTYNLTNHTDRFEVIGDQLFYIGTALDFENPKAPKIFLINVLQSRADGSTQTFEYVVNLLNLEEVLTITPPNSNTPILSDGEGLLDENTRKGDELGTIDDSINAAGSITYRLTAPAEGNDNGLFLVSADGLRFIYNGEQLDYDDPATQKIFILRIERIRDGDTDNPQPFQYVVNLENLDDNDPVLTVEGGTIDGTKLQILSDVSGTVGNGGAAFVLALSGIPLAGKSLDIELTNTDPDGNALPQTNSAERKILLSITRQDPEDTTSNIEKITFHYSFNSFGPAEFLTKLKEIFSDTGNILSAYSPMATGSPSGLVFGSRDTFSILPTATPILRVDKDINIDNPIADFSGTDKDGDKLIYSLADTTALSGDANYFTIDEDGNLRFNADNPLNANNKPLYRTGAGADNTHDITIGVSDDGGLTVDDTFNLQVIVADIL